MEENSSDFQVQRSQIERGHGRGYEMSDYVEDLIFLEKLGHPSFAAISETLIE